MSILMPTRPKLWPWLTAIAVMSLAWIAYVMYGNYQHWLATGLEEPMGATIRNGVLAIFCVVAIAYAVGWGAQLNLAAPETRGAESKQGGSTMSPHAVQGVLANNGQRYVLEVRGLGVVVDRGTNDEIWDSIEQKADNFLSILSSDPKDYPDSSGIRLSDLDLSEGLAFRLANRRAVEYWPIPVVIWEPSKDKLNSTRAADGISDNRQQAGLGVHLFLWQDDANTDDGAAMIKKLFELFDKHPDVPAALLFSSDSMTLRRLLGRPSSSGLPPEKHIIPAIPDSVVGLLVSRSDRVDRLIRPYVVEQTAAVNKDTTQYDISRLWNFFWQKANVQRPDGFNAYYQDQVKDRKYQYPTTIGTMSADWWQKQLPELWKQIGNQGPGRFTPTPYIPVRWTSWQLQQFDNAPLIGYLHRPVEVKLTGEDGKALNRAGGVAALKAGWAQAVEALPPDSKPKRVFYDTTGDRQWVISLTQALSGNPSGPHLDDVKEGYDIGRRIGNTGVSSPMVQLGLGLIASYKEGGVSATIDRRPNGDAMIVMVSPADDESKENWNKRNGGRDPFK